MRGDAAVGLSWLMEQGHEIPPASLEAVVGTLEGQSNYDLLGRYLKFIALRQGSNQAGSVVTFLGALKDLDNGLSTMRETMSASEVNGSHNVI